MLLGSRLHFHVVNGSLFIRYIQIQPDAFGIITFLLCFLRFNQLNYRDGNLQNKLQKRFQMTGIPHHLGEHIVVHQGQLVNGFESAFQRDPPPSTCILPKVQGKIKWK